MTRQPACDERLLGARPPTKGDERIFLTELAKYLRVRAGFIKRFANKRGVLRSDRSAMRRRVWWVDAHGARAVIAYVRALQGAKWLAGRCPFDRGGQRPRSHPVTVLAISGAGAEDEASAAPADIVIAETAVVCMNVAT